MQTAANAVRPRALCWLAFFVLLCICLQALLLPAQRAAERAHIHLGAAHASTAALEQGLSGKVVRFEHHASSGHAEHHEDDHGHGDRVRAGRVQGHGHAHAQLAVHDHEHGDADDAVYADVPDSGSTTGHAHGLKRVLLDLDVPWMASAPLMSDQRARPVFVEPTRIFRSHIVLPLERPPRARG